MRTATRPGLLFASAVLLALGLIACSDGESPDGGKAAFNVAGFSDHTGPSNNAPSDVIAAGGTLRACNPPHLYAFVNFSGLKPPKDFAGTWTLNGGQINRQSFVQDRTSAQSFFEVQNTPLPLTAGTYRFELRVDDKPATQASFTLTC